MLGKLIKYEFKATSRFMVLMYGLFLALSAIISVGVANNLDEVFSEISDKLNFGGLIIGVFVALIVIMFVIMNVVVISGMFFYSVKRFKDNLLGDEGYLMHTLPVKTRDNILSKCIVSVIWTFASILTVAVGYTILVFGISETDIFGITAQIFSQIDLGFNYTTQLLLIFLEIFVCVTVIIINIYLHIYASMAVGFSQNEHKVAKSIGVYILITVAANIFESAIAPLMNIYYTYQTSDLANFHFTILYGIIISCITGTAYYFITKYYLSKRLNLQ